MALTTVSSDRLSTNVKNTNFTAAEKQDLTDDILPLAGQLGNRNILHNGSFIVHQRGGTTTSPGFLLDRWYSAMNGGTATFSQGTETSGTVYEKGLVNYCRITNTANSTASSAYRYLRQSIEAQNLLKSGWNYKSASAKITLSFYVRSSVAQNFYGYLRLSDSPNSRYPFETGSLTADTWTKVTKVIPGYASGNIDNDNGSGMEVLIAPFWGTGGTDSGVTLNTWAAFNGAQRFPDYATTWAGTNGATFDVTGVQLEVGSVATDFEHRSFGQELELCQRYFYKIVGQDSDMAAFGFNYSASDHYFNIEFPVPMRDYPTYTGSATAARIFAQNIGQDFNLSSLAIVGNMTSSNPKRVTLFVSQGGATAGEGGLLSLQNAEGSLSFSAEL
jgi:hypothetical protein|tara:strand:- start:172 stop:1335 length:1164 start_codon:yes stop_codon:yes gene_type:complete